MISRYQKMISRGIIPDILISANAVPLVNIYLSNSPISQRVFPSGGQLCDGWYICAAVLTPFFHFGRIEHDLFGGIFSHPPTPKRSFGVLKLPILKEFDLLGPKFHFSLDLFGSNFQRPAAHPHQFSDRVPPPPPPRDDKQPTAGCIAIFHKYCCYTKRGDITKNLTLRNHWWYVTDVSKYPVTMRVNGAWIKRYCVLCSKTYNISHSCHNPAGSRQAARGACICETSLLGVLRQYTGTGHYRIGSVYIASWVIASWVVVTAELEIIASWDDRTSNC